MRPFIFLSYSIHARARVDMIREYEVSATANELIKEISIVTRQKEKQVLLSMHRSNPVHIPTNCFVLITGQMLRCSLKHITKRSIKVCLIFVHFFGTNRFEACYIVNENEN